MAEHIVTTDAIGKLPKQQRDVLVQIALNNDCGHAPATLKALQKKGLIEPHEDLIRGTGTSTIDRIPMIVTRYTVPTGVHIAVCEWCSENLDDEEGGAS